MTSSDENRRRGKTCSRGTSAVAAFVLLAFVSTIPACAPELDEPTAIPATDLEVVNSASTIGNWADAKIPPSVKSLFENAKTLFEAYSNIASGIEAAQTLLRLMGFLKTGPTQEEMFNMLMSEIRNVGTAVTYKLDQAKHSQALGSMTQALGEAESLMSRGLPVFGFASLQDYTTGSYVAGAEADPTFFTRYFVESATDGFWKSVVSKRAAVSNNLVYDWRLSVPALMQLIALRLQVMAAVDNNFKSGTLYDIELQRHQAALERQFTKLVGGPLDGVTEPGAIQCEARYWVGGSNSVSPPGVLPLIDGTAILVTVCADIYSGAFSRRDVVPADFASRPECSATTVWTDTQRGTHRIQHVLTNSACAQEVRAELERDALSKLPLPALRTAIDDLAKYRDPSVASSLTTTACQAMAEQHGIVAGSTFGTAPSAEQTTWMKRGCSQRASWLDRAYAMSRFPIDYNADGLADVAVWRPSSGEWRVLGSGSTTITQFGANTDVPVAGDFVGDSKTDLAVWRPDGGKWLIRSTTPSVLPPFYTVTTTTKQLGAKGDIPVPTDYDGDRRTDPAVWRPSDGKFYVSSSLYGAFNVSVGALASDIPAPGDYDGDGKGDFVVWRPSTGGWLGTKSLGGTMAMELGIKGDIPVPGDFDGDGRFDIAVFRPLEGKWWVVPSGGTPILIYQFGILGDVPVPADFDGDRKADIAVFRPSTSTWFILRSGTNNSSYWTFTNGQSGDVAVP